MVTQPLLPRPALWRRMSARTWRRTLAFYAFIGPWLAGFVLLGVVPLALALFLSTTNYDGLNWGQWKFQGLGNYARAFSDNDARHAFVQTLRWTGLNLPLWIVLSFILALILNQDVKGRGLFRTLYYLPNIIPIVATVWVWKIFLDKNYGLLNAIISLVRPGTAIPWLSTQALFGLTWIAVWSGMGWGMVIFLAGLQDIPDELIDAARIDGAGSLQVFWHITLPLMTPVIFLVLISGLIGSFQQFQLPLLLGTGTAQLSYPPRPVYLYMLHVYYQNFVYQRFGYGTALVWLIFIVILGLALVLFRTQRYWVYYESAE